MANSFYLDASALAKRYIPEKGSNLVDAIVDTVSADRIFLLNIGAGEVMSILVRKRNAGIISAGHSTELKIGARTLAARPDSSLVHLFKMKKKKAGSIAAPSLSPSAAPVPAFFATYLPPRDDAKLLAPPLRISAIPRKN